MTHTPFSHLLSALQPDAAGFAIELPPDWLQGRTAYGGLSASLCLHATLSALDGLPPLRSAQFCFVGPATGLLRLAPRVLRRGKSTMVVGVDLEGDSGLAVRATFCFGASRPVAQTHAALPMPAVTPPDGSPPFFTWPDRPRFMDHFDGRLAEGAVPRTPQQPPEMTVWLRHQDVQEGCTPVRLLSLADALPPAALILYRQPVPISTMTWAIEFLDDQPQTDGGWWLARTVADASAQGYSAQGTVVWNRAGRPALVARQNVAIFG